MRLVITSVQNANDSELKGWKKRPEPSCNYPIIFFRTKKNRAMFCGYASSKDLANFQVDRTNVALRYGDRLDFTIRSCE